VRFCASCGKHVYNFTAMSTEEAVSLIRDKNGELCGQLFRRQDGRLVTSDCQPQPLPTPRPWQFSIRSLMAVIAGMAAVFGITKLVGADRTQAATGATTATPTFVGGKLCMPPKVMQTISNQPRVQSE